MNDDVRTLKIGIASRDEMKARTLAIARGELRPAPDDPRVWFTSIESLAQVLSSKNLLLLELIRQMKPTSMAELARRSGRKVSNLSRTLHTMEHYGFVRIRREGLRRIPETVYDRIDASLVLGATLASGALESGRLQVVR
jgi:predicted transcriptional regulator